MAENIKTFADRTLRCRSRSGRDANADSLSRFDTHERTRVELMTVTEYLKSARQCAELAERMTGDDKRKVLAIADAWLELAKSAAEMAAGVPLAPVSFRIKGSAR